MPIIFIIYQGREGLANALFNMVIPLASVLGEFIAGEVYTIFVHTAQPWRYLFMAEGILGALVIGIANAVGNLVGTTMGVFLPGLSLTIYHSYVLGMHLTGYYR